MMKNFNKKALALATVAMLATGLSSQAHAGAKSFAHLKIDNFQIFKSDGTTQYTTNDFSTLDIGDTSGVSAVSTAHGGAVNQILDADLGGDDNMACVGLGCNPGWEDDFTQQPPPVNGSFVRADTRLLGALIDNLHVEADALAEGQTSVTDEGTGGSTVGTITTFAFEMMANDTITFDFDAIAFMEVILHQEEHDVQASVGFSIDIIDVENAHGGGLNSNIFNFSPGEINTGIGLNGTGQDIYAFNSNTLITGEYNVTSGLLFAGTDYRLVISQDADIHFDAVKPIPEPATLAIFGLALMGLASTRRSKT
jgi:hypothetical protein